MLYSHTSDAKRLTINYARFWNFQIILDNAKIMPENSTKEYAINVIVLDLSQKGSNYARIMLKFVSVKSLC